jgi:hypothetical protein
VDRPLLLNQAQTLCGAVGTLVQVFMTCAGLVKGEFPVEVGIEFFSPSLASHDSQYP